MKAKFAYKLASLIVAVLVAVFTVGYAFAWILNRKDANFGIRGETAGAYFAGGDGSKDEPYQIANKNHMYNLAWLQNMGRLIRNSGDNKFYFVLNNDIDMSENTTDGTWLPPIGNDDKPFISEFDGKGYTIKNLKITTDKNKLTNCPIKTDDTYEFSNAVGLFGKTGEDSNIRNFILENPIVQVADETAAGVDTKYASSGKKAAGIAVGYVANRCQSIGVRAIDGDTRTTLDVDRAGYSTFNSILGTLDESVQSSVTGGGYGSGGSGASFGSFLNLNRVRQRFLAILANGGASSKLPQIESGGTAVAAGEILPLTALDKPSADGSTLFDYSGADAEESISPTNTGFVCGNQNKITTNRINFDSKFIMQGRDNGKSVVWSEDKTKLVWEDTKQEVNQAVEFKTTEEGQTPQTFFKRVGQNAVMDTTSVMPMSENEIKELPQNIQNLLVPENAANNSSDPWLLRLQNKFEGTSGSLTENGKYSCKPSMNYYGHTYTKVWLPNDGIWLKPKNVGKFQFVIYTHNNGQNFTLYRLSRTKGANSKERSECATEEEYLQDYFSTRTISSSAITELHTTELPLRALIYFEHDVTQTELDNDIEFLLGNDRGGNGAYFLYLDVGTSAAEDISTVVPDKVSAVDFIYEGVSIEQTDTTLGVGNFVDTTTATLYEASKTSIYFEGTQNSLEIVYLRLHGRSDQKTIHLTNYTAENIASAEVHATFARYVLPEGIQGGSGSASGGGSGGGNTGGEVVDPDPAPTPIATLTKSGSGWTAMAVGDTVLSNEYATVSAQCVFQLRSGNVQSRGGAGSGVFQFSLATGYKYTITIGAQSNSSSGATRALTLNGITRDNITNSEFTVCTWEIDLTSVAIGETLDYIMTQNNNCNIDSIAISITN